MDEGGLGGVLGLGDGGSEDPNGREGAQGAQQDRHATSERAGSRRSSVDAGPAARVRPSGSHRIRPFVPRVALPDLADSSAAKDSSGVPVAEHDAGGELVPRANRLRQQVLTISLMRGVLRAIWWPCLR